MPFLSSFATYGGIIVAAASLVAAGAEALARGARGTVSVVCVVLVALHLAIAVLGVPAPPLMSSALVLTSSIAGAVLLGRALAAPGAVVVFAITASVVDIVSFSGGATRWLLTADTPSTSRALQFLTVSVSRGEGMVAVVGIGDLLVFGALYLALRSSDCRRTTVLVGLLAALLVALVVGLLRGGAFGIPFMALFAAPMAWLQQR